MEHFNRRKLEELIADEGRPRVSLYLPTYRTGRDVRQNSIRLKNLLAEAATRLGARGLSEVEATTLLAPAADLLDSTGFAEQQLDGLAVLVGDGRLHEFRCPRQFDELCYVDDHFHLKPLLPLLSAGETYMLLSLSRNTVRLYAGARDGLAELPTATIPGSLPDALGHDVEQPSLQVHSTGRGMGGRETTMFHGHGGGEGDRNDELVRFLQLVDDGLHQRFPGQRPPVVLAGVEEVVHKFHHLSKYGALVSGGVLGNPESLGPERLHEESWALARPVLEADAESAAARFRELKGTELATDDLARIGPAAAIARVDTLFVAADRSEWGTIAPDGSIEVSAQRREGDVELLDRVAVLALRRGSTVHARRLERMPEQRPIAAVMRY